MIKESLFFQRTLERRKFFIVSSPHNDEMKEFVHQLQQHQATIIKNYQDTIDNINKYTKYVVRKYDFKFECRIYDHENIEELFDEQEYSDAYRGAIIVSDVNYANNAILEQLGVSHFLYLVSTENCAHGWNNGIHQDCTSFNNSLKDHSNDSKLLFCWMIVDLMLDISAFNSLEWFGQYATTRENKQKISSLKSRFLNLEGKKLFYGPLLNTELPYISFASAVRDSFTIFDREQCEEYSSLLEKFFPYVFSSIEIPLPDITNPEDIIDEFKKYYKGFGHLSNKKVQPLLEAIDAPGKYCLITYRSRCKLPTKRVKNKLANLFRTSNIDDLKLHTPQVVSWNDFLHWSKHNNFLSFFLFTINSLEGKNESSK